MGGRGDIEAIVRQTRTAGSGDSGFGTIMDDQEISAARRRNIKLERVNFFVVFICFRRIEKLNNSQTAHDARKGNKELFALGKPATGQKRKQRIRSVIYANPDCHLPNPVYSRIWLCRRQGDCPLPARAWHY
jgi:hypothetical protein